MRTTLAMRDVWPHTHGKREHSHAWSSLEHSHLLREVCQRPECVGSATHNIHPAPPSFEDEERLSRAS